VPIIISVCATEDELNAKKVMMLMAMMGEPWTEGQLAVSAFRARASERMQIVEQFLGNKANETEAKKVIESERKRTRKWFGTAIERSSSSKDSSDCEAQQLISRRKCYKFLSEPSLESVPLNRNIRLLFGLIVTEEDAAWTTFEWLPGNETKPIWRLRLVVVNSDA
jgi:hypothetical protein